MKAAEGCALAIAGNFPPETVARATCPIVIDKDFPINQVMILFNMVAEYFVLF